ncbi:hypothetical protein Tco_1522228 [Tanacetum coccineum]
MSTHQDINAFRAQRITNTHDPLALMANTQTPFHPDQSSLITYLQHPQPNNNFVQQPLFNTNYMPQPMQNFEDSSDPTTAMNKALALIAKAFKINTIPTNNNQRSSLIPRNNQIAQPDMNTSQDIKMQMVDDNVGNQVRQNAVQNVGNEVGQNAVQNPECEFMAAADAYKEIERVKVNCTLEDTLQQASILGTQSDNAPIYTQIGSPEDQKNENDMIMSNPSKTSRVDNVVPNKPIKTSVRIKPIIVSQLNVIHKQQANSDSNGFSSTRVNNTAKTRRPHPKSNTNTNRVPSKSKSSCLSNNVKKIEENHRNSQIPKNQKHMSSECNNITLAIRNAKSEIVCVMCKQCLVTANHDVCVLNYVNDMNSRADNQSANVSIRENQKKHKANAKKSKELGSKGSLASSRPSKPRTCLRWIPTGRIFAMCGKLTASSNTKNKSKKSVCDNASTSNPSKPSSKGSPISTSLLGRISKMRYCEGFNRVLWGDLMIMFNPDDEDKFWNSQQDWNVVSWKLHGSSGVHTLMTKTGLVIHMLVDKKYPLRKKVLLQMLELKLESEEDSTMALELIRFVKKLVAELEPEDSDGDEEDL